jgi:hypothetical protein
MVVPEDCCALPMNLATVECAEGNDVQALETLERLMDFAPDDRRARAFTEAFVPEESYVSKVKDFKRVPRDRSRQ